MSALAAAATWSVGLWRLARGRIRADWRFLVGVWVLLVCATTLLASGIVYGDAVALGSLRAVIRAAPLAEQSVLVDSTLTPAQVGLADPAVRNGLTTMLGAPGGTVALELRSGSLVRVGTAASGSSAVPQLTLLESVDDLSRHAQLSSGRWPVAGKRPFEAVVSTGAATALGVHAGDVVPLADASTPGADAAHAVATVTIVGTYAPVAADPFWAGDQLDLEGTGAVNGTTYDGPFVVDGADLRTGPTSRLDARWRAIPDLDNLTGDDIEPLRARLDALPASIHGSFPVGSTANVSLQLSQRLDALATSLGVARGAVLVLTLQFAVVAAYAVLLVSGMLADRRRPEIGLLRSRGGSTAHVAALAFGEAFLLAVPAVIVAPFAATGLIRLLGRVGPLASTGAVADASPSPTALVVIATTGLVAAIVLALPALASGAELAGIRAVLGRPVARTLGQRLGIDVALLAVAAIAIWQLRNYGQPLTRDVHGALGLDPLLAAAPAFGLVAGGVIATRLVPRIGEVSERLLSHVRGLLSPLAARQVARRPLRYTRAALLLILASALGTFGAVYAATWSSSHADQAAYQSGADVRVVAGAGSRIPDWAVAPLYRSVPDVAAALPVARGPLAVGTVVRNGTALGVDARALGGVMLPPPGASGAADLTALDALAAADPQVDVLPLPASTTGLRVRFDAALTQPVLDLGQAKLKVPPDYRGVVLTAVIEDADGAVARFAMPATEDLGLFAGTGQSITIPFLDLRGATHPGAEPWTLLGVEVHLNNAFGGFLPSSVYGTLTVTGIDSTSAASGTGTWSPVAAGSLGDWSWQQLDSGQVSQLSTGLTGKLPNLGDAAPLGDTEMRFVARAPSSTRIPAIAGDQLLALTGSELDQALTASAGGSDLSLQIVGHVTEFPTVDPASPFVILDTRTWSTLAYLTGGAPPGATEWWLKTDPGTSSSVAQAVTTIGLRPRSVTDRAAVLASLEQDPVGLGTLGALLLGSLAAAAFAVVGFLVGSSVAANERIAEFALLRALGLSQGQLSRWLAAEAAFLLALGVLAGTAIGLLLGWLIVPSTLLSPTGAPLVPTPELQVPWPLVGLAYAGALALLVATIVVVGRPLPGRRVAMVLRAAEE